MAELGPNEVKVMSTQNFKDDETQRTYYNGDEVVVDSVTASRMVNEYGAEVLEEGEATEGNEAEDAPETPAE